jgi:hypothetical protein
VKTALCFVAALLLAVCTPVRADKISAQAAHAARQGNVRVIVMLEDQAPATALQNNELRRRDVRARTDATLARLAPGDYILKRRFAVVPAFAAMVNAQALAQLEADPAVRRIDLDAPGGAHAIAPDESSVLNTVSQLVGQRYDGTGMKVAIIDSGIDTDHPDLASRLVGEQCFCSNASGVGGCCPNGQAAQSGAGAAEDAHGHGTNVAGIVVGQGNVAPRGAVPMAQLVAVRVMDSSNRFCCSSDIVAAMDWVANKHPDVDAVNISLGTDDRFDGDCDGANAYTQALAAAVNNLVAHGAVVTVSSGNAGSMTQMEAPACVRNALSVGATWDFSGGSRTFLGCTETSTSPRQPTCFTNRSATTDLYAAGAFVTAPGLNSGISTFGGTSQAAPMVAACATALKQAAPLSTVAERMETIRLATDYILIDSNARSYPFLDCASALATIMPNRARSDFNDDRRSDVLWRHALTGANAIWRSANLATSQAIANVNSQAWIMAGAADFDGDGTADILWRDTTTGANTIWRSASTANRQNIFGVTNQAWKVAGLGDLNGDGKADILWRNSGTGANVIWLSALYTTQQGLPAVNLEWSVQGVDDFNNDGAADILWRNFRTGANVLWRSGLPSQSQSLTAATNLAWRIAGTGDFNGDRKADILWRNGTTGANVIWYSGLSGSNATLGTLSDLKWQVAAVGDYDGDGQSDLLWRHAGSGDIRLWPAANAAFGMSLGTVADANWKVIP